MMFCTATWRAVMLGKVRETVATLGWLPHRVTPLGKGDRQREGRVPQHVAQVNFSQGDGVGQRNVPFGFGDDRHGGRGNLHVDIRCGGSAAVNEVHRQGDGHHLAHRDGDLHRLCADGDILPVCRRTVLPMRTTLVVSVRVLLISFPPTEARGIGDAFQGLCRPGDLYGIRVGGNGAGQAVFCLGPDELAPDGDLLGLPVGPR